MSGEKADDDDDDDDDGDDDDEDDDDDDDDAAGGGGGIDWSTDKSAEKCGFASSQISGSSWDFPEFFFEVYIIVLNYCVSKRS